MVRTITTSVTVYQFSELTPDAQENAVLHVRELLAGDWWDSSDQDDIQDAMVYTLAERLGSPRWDTHGSVDFPGIATVTVQSWDLGRRQHLAVSGTLTRENAPLLPWVDGITEVDLIAHRYGTQVDVIEDEPDTCPPRERATIEGAVTDALHSAWKAGESETERKTSEEYAREEIEANGREFLEDGTPN